MRGIECNLKIPSLLRTSGPDQHKWNLKLCCLARNSRYLFNQAAIATGVASSHMAVKPMQKAMPGLTVFLAVNDLIDVYRGQRSSSTCVSHFTQRVENQISPIIFKEQENYVYFLTDTFGATAFGTIRVAECDIGRSVSTLTTISVSRYTVVILSVSSHAILAESGVAVIVEDRKSVV